MEPRDRLRDAVVRAVPAVLILAFLAWFGTSQATNRYWITLGIQALYVAIAVVGLNLLIGSTGLLSLGHYAFFVYGGFLGAIWVVEDWGLSPYLGFPIAALGGAVLGALLALTCCHLRGFYLTVVTLAFGLISSSIALLFDSAFNGLAGRPVTQPLDTSYTWLDASNPNRSFVGLYWIGVVLLVVSVLLTANLAHSRVGRAYHAIRDSELAARASGVPTYWYKVSAFALSAGLVSLAGVLAAQTNLTVTMVDGTAIVGLSFEWVTYAFFGGLGTLAGPIVGAFTFTLGLGFSVGDDSLTDRLGEWDTLFYGVLIIVVAIAVPGGLVGTLRRVGGRLWRRVRGDRPARPVVVDDALCRPRPRTADPGDETVLVVDGISKHFGGVSALAGIDLDVRPGTVHALIGPNGSGKSTLVNVISGVHAPERGRVRFRGRDLIGLAPNTRNRLGIARTFQACQIWRRMTVLDNVRVGAHARQRTPFVASLLLPPVLRREEARSEERALGLLRFVGLAERARDLAETLPFADQRRLEIARALASDPDVLLLDEPAAGTHPGEARELVALVKEIRAAGITVVLIEHHMDVVMELADEVTVLDRGEVLAHGPPADVARDRLVIEAYLGEEEVEPATTRVAASTRAAVPREAEPVEPLLAVRDLYVRYGAARALRGISLDVYPGEIVAIIGGNGAGKSTSLKTVSGVAELLKSVQGEIRFAGERVDRAPAHRIARMGIAHVPEGRRVFAESTVEENLLLGGHTIHGPDLRAGVDDAYERFPILAERRRQPAGLLSGGEQQMLAIARGLVSRPRCLLLDEPSLGLAPLVAADVLATVRTLADEGTTILLVEQLAAKALEIADRAYVLETGVVTVHGTAADLAADPQVREAYLGT